MMVLGLNAYHADVSAALLRDGQLVAAVEEERFRRVKHWAGFPRESIRACLEIAGARAEEVDHFVISRNPRANLLRKAMFAVRHGPVARLVRDRWRNARRVHDLGRDLAEAVGLERERVRSRLKWVEHHPAHLASAFFVSPFEEAAVCAIDGSGDFVTTSLAVGRGSKLEVLREVFFPHSLGVFYLAITQYLGFLGYGDEFKVMGLAAYGEPEYREALRRLVRVERGGGFELDLSYFRHHTGAVTMTWDGGQPVIGAVYTDKLERLLGPARRPEEPLTSRHEAVAASLQAVFEETAVHVLTALHARTRLRRLCLAGGCAMNSVLNGRIRERTPFEALFVQPAAGDSGTALGAALYLWHQARGEPRRFVMDHGFWGPEFSEVEVSRILRERATDLDGSRCAVTRMADPEALCRWTAERIAQGNIVGWFQGRMEWGPRALGNRSIVADPRRPDIRDLINAKIKFREPFRPFAPSVLEEALDQYFIGASPDPFMVHVWRVRPDKRRVIPAVIHVDGSGRPQTVSRKTHPVYWRLLTAFERLTGVPVLLNTSFNENEPIVRRPDEALDCFLRTKMDVLVLGQHVVEKPEARRGP